MIGMIAKTIAAIFFAFCLLGFEEPVPEGAVLITETCTVAAGDTLDGIAARYMAKNNYGPRDVREFRQGIIELNYDLLGSRDNQALIYPGDRLRINYWRVDK